MKKFISTHLPTAQSLAGIAHEILLETRAAAATRVSDLRSQVDDLWQAAEDMLPHARPAAIMNRVEKTVEKTISALQKRDAIGFPKPLKA
jgi:anti-sigma factor RsiW